MTALSDTTKPEVKYLLKPECLNQKKHVKCDPDFSKKLSSWSLMYSTLQYGIGKACLFISVCLCVHRL